MMRLTGAYGSVHSACVAALLGWRRIVLMLHPYGGLLAFAVALPKDVGISLLPAAETLVTGHTSVALFAILGAIFPDLF